MDFKIEGWEHNVTVNMARRWTAWLCGECWDKEGLGPPPLAGRSFSCDRCGRDSFCFKVEGSPDA